MALMSHLVIVSENFLLDCKTSGSMCLTLLLKLNLGPQATELVMPLAGFYCCWSSLFIDLALWLKATQYKAGQLQLFGRKLGHTKELQFFGHTKTFYFYLDKKCVNCVYFGYFLRFLMSFFMKKWRIKLNHLAGYYRHHCLKMSYPSSLPLLVCVCGLEFWLS